MKVTNVADAKARLSEYLERAARGERIVICRHNKPVAELRAAGEIRTEPRPLGPLPGRPTFRLPESFFDPLPDDEVQAWEEGSLMRPDGTATPHDGASRVAEGHATHGPRQRARRPRR